MGSKVDANSGGFCNPVAVAAARTVGFMSRSPFCGILQPRNSSSGPFRRILQPSNSSRRRSGPFRRILQPATDGAT